MIELHLVKGLDPVANAFAGAVSSDIIAVQGEGIHFVIYKGVGATGTATITVDACDDTTPTTTAAVDFWYRACTTGDTWGDWTHAASTGFTTTAGSSQLYEIYVPSAVLAEKGYGYARLTSTEVVANAVLGGILAFVDGLRYGPQPESLID